MSTIHDYFIPIAFSRVYIYIYIYMDYGVLFSFLYLTYTRDCDWTIKRKIINTIWINLIQHETEIRFVAYARCLEMLTVPQLCNP